MSTSEQLPKRQRSLQAENRSESMKGYNLVKSSIGVFIGSMLAGSFASWPDSGTYPPNINKNSSIVGSVKSSFDLIGSFFSSGSTSFTF